MIKRLIKLANKRKKKVDKICSDFDKIHEKIIKKSLDKIPYLCYTIYRR